MSTAQWHDSEPSDEEIHHDQLSSRKRSSRACDQCRKTKSKCEPSPVPGACKSCAIGGNTCTFLGPSYKRGPPKGYIQAIEQRWHQVEALLGAIIASPDPRVQDLLAEIREDDLAREILDKVDSGPFGPSGRLTQATGATKEDFVACIVQSNEIFSRDASRHRRQSRVSREIVSSSRVNSLLTVPSTEWQDRLTARLTKSRSNTKTTGRLSHSPARASSVGSAAHRHRIDKPVLTSELPNWEDMYTMDAVSDSDDMDESRVLTAFGQLSLDENQEVRYHGKASGLHLLSRSDRSDKRNEGGVWRLPMARFWPSTRSDVPPVLPKNDLEVKLLPLAVQDQLVGLYFSYVHPMFPVIHKGRFLREWNEWKRSRRSNPATPEANGIPLPQQPEASQTVTKLLLLSMFSFAAHYVDNNNPRSIDNLCENCEYFTQAKNLLAQVHQSCRATTCQALLLLGNREFGIGSMEQGWLYIGMAIRMALDLGLNRSADSWQCNGERMFSPEESQVRKQIWWACCIADKFSSIYMGRPVSINESDFDTLLVNPEEYEHEDDADVVTCQPLPAVLVMNCFRAAAALSVIIGSIASLVYPVKSNKCRSMRTILNDLEARLDRWYHGLPENLRYDPASKRTVPPPPVLFIHIKYWFAVLLLHRAFIPNWRGPGVHPQNKPTNADIASMRAFDLCQSAATHISTIVTTYHDNFDIKYSSPFLSSYMLCAGIMHIITLTLVPSDAQAFISLRQLSVALWRMRGTWPSAGRTDDLLNGAKVQVDSDLLRLEENVDRQKRGADDAFGQEKSSDLLLQQALDGADDTVTDGSAKHMGGIQDMSTRLMADMLGLDIPGIEPSTSFFPGYEWWPRTATTLPHSSLQPQIAGVTNQDTLINSDYLANQLYQAWDVQGPSSFDYYQYNFQGPFDGHC